MWAPDLKKVRYKSNERNAEDGKPMLFFWQMEGRRWELDGSSFEVAKKAHARYCATQTERTKEIQARYARAYNFKEQQAEVACRAAVP